MAIVANTISIKQLRLPRRITTSSSHTRQQAGYAKLLQQPGRSVVICSMTSDGVKVCINQTVPQSGDMKDFEKTVAENLTKAVDDTKDGPKKK